MQTAQHPLSTTQPVKGVVTGFSKAFTSTQRSSAGLRMQYIKFNLLDDPLDEDLSQCMTSETCRQFEVGQHISITPPATGKQFKLAPFPKDTSPKIQARQQLNRAAQETRQQAQTQPDQLVTRAAYKELLSRHKARYALCLGEAASLIQQSGIGPAEQSADVVNAIASQLFQAVAADLS